MVRRGSFIGGQDNLSVPDAPTIGAATAGNTSVSVAFTAPSDVGDDPITGYAVIVTDGTNIFNNTGSSSPITVTGLTNGTDYTANVWAINDYGNGPLSDATSTFSPALQRGLFAMGTVSPRQNVIDYVSIGTTGNAVDFGDATNERQVNQSLMSSTTRAVFTAGISDDATYEDTMDYVTIASTGNATDFGNLSVARFNLAACSSVTRGINFNGSVSSGTANTIDYITIASTGNATDFGDNNNTAVRSGASSSPTRGVKFGGSSEMDSIGYITIASTGDASDFGDLTVNGSDPAGVSSNTRICIAGRSSTGGTVNTIDYITTASTGNATDFGDLNNSVYGAAGTSNRTRGLIGGGISGPINVIDYITIASTGNATDFGDLTVARRAMSTGSDAHGGIS